MKKKSFGKTSKIFICLLTLSIIFCVTTSVMNFETQKDLNSLITSKEEIETRVSRIEKLIKKYESYYMYDYYN